MYVIQQVVTGTPEVTFFYILRNVYKVVDFIKNHGSVFLKVIFLDIKTGQTYTNVTHQI